MDQLLQEMIEVLKYNVSTTNMFLVAFDGTNPRLTSGLQKMMAQFEALFGRIFWDNAEMLITKWPMDQHSQVRSRNCQLNIGSMVIQCSIIFLLTPTQTIARRNERE